MTTTKMIINGEWMDNTNDPYIEVENPATEETAPSGVTFGDYASDLDMLTIGDLTAGNIYGVWIREVIMEDHRAKADAIGDLYFNWS